MSDKPTPQSGKGFAGLESLVSDISKDLKPVASRPVPNNAPMPAPPQSTVSSQPTPISIPPSPNTFFGRNAKLFGLFAIAVVVTAAIVFQSPDKPSPKLASPPTTSYTTTPPSSPPSSTSPRINPPSSTSPRINQPAPATSVPAPAAAPAVPTLEYERPPVGRDLALSVSQIRYCKREKIRLEAIDAVINAKSNYEIDRFNALVEDYNSRCANYRYRRGDLERVEREIGSLRSSIIAAAQSEWRR